MENQREKTEPIKRSNWHIKSIIKKHGVVNNINDFLLSGYKRKYFKMIALLKKKKERTKNEFIEWNRQKCIQCIILNIESYLQTFYQGFFFVWFFFHSFFPILFHLRNTNFGWTFESNVLYQICCDPKLDKYFHCFYFRFFFCLFLFQLNSTNRKKQKN